MVGTSGDSHSSHGCQLPHVIQGTGQSLAAQNSSSKTALMPGSGSVLPLGTQLLCQQLRFIAAFTLNWEVSRPGSRWKMGVGASLVPSVMWMCCCSAWARG